MMKNKLVLLGCATILSSGLAGCASIDRATEDLFAPNHAEQASNSGRIAPLVVPPDFSLTPAESATVRPQDGAAELTLDAIFGGAADRPTSEQAIIKTAGSSENGIRSNVGDPETITVNKGSVTRDIIAAPEGDGQSAQAVAGG